MIRLALTALIALLPGTAMACLTMALGEEHHLTGPELADGRSFAVIAGGPQALASCGLNLLGHVQADPNFSFHLSDMQGYGLQASVAAECDTLLILNGESINGEAVDFITDDDSGGDLNPLVTIPAGVSLDQRLDVWVGTYGPDSCPAVLTLRSIRP
jgi:hypothetical protein